MTSSITVRQPRSDARDNRVGIIRAATVALADDPHASVDAIARAAGLSRRALYGHFEDRDALVREVIAEGAARYNEIARSIDDADARVALARLASRLWNAAAAVQVAAAIALDETHVTETAVALAPLRAVVTGIVRRGQAAGTLRGDVAAATLTRLIEETARTIVTRVDASSPDPRSLAVRAVSSIAGLSWRETWDMLDAHPDLLEDD